MRLTNNISRQFYENLPIQYTEIFSPVKKVKISLKQNIDFASTHNLCFASKIRKKSQTSQFYNINVGYKVVYISGTCFPGGC